MRTSTTLRALRTATLAGLTALGLAACTIEQDGTVTMNDSTGTDSTGTNTAGPLLEGSEYDELLSDEEKAALLADEPTDEELNAAVAEAEAEAASMTFQIATAEVVRVVDGDTLIVTGLHEQTGPNGEQGAVPEALPAGAEHTVDLIGVTVPENCWSQESVAALNELVAIGDTVGLQYDETVETVTLAADNAETVHAHVWALTENQDPQRLLGEMMLTGGNLIQDGEDPAAEQGHVYAGVHLSAQNTALGEQRGAWNACRIG